VRIIPVIDVMGGVVVRAVGGRREEYRPIQSRLTNSTDPRKVAQILLDTSGAGELYVADLDRIVCGESLADWQFFGDLSASIILDRGGLSYWGEYGPGRFDRVRLVQASELALPPEDVSLSFRKYALHRPPLYSVDLWNGELRGLWDQWGVDSGNCVVDYVRRVYEIGFRSFIVLDVTAVGTEQGCPTIDYCTAIRTELPDIELITGGGIRNWDDVKRLEDAGADAVLVASALHDGTLTFPRPAS
jgi:phosphoribosylformimino-5-aminoimidazole carboxamide ribotide isomerase